MTDQMSIQGQSSDSLLKLLLTSPQFQGYIRQGLTTLSVSIGAFFIQKGWFTKDSWASFSGALGQAALAALPAGIFLFSTLWNRLAHSNKGLLTQVSAVSAVEKVEVSTQALAASVPSSKVIAAPGVN